MASQLDQVLLRIREMILNGQLAPGERLAEVPLAERLGVSRTPVRHAVTLLEAEGLLERSGARSYAVRRFSFRDVADAMDVRGALEGVAARVVAEQGMRNTLRDVLEECVARGEAIVAKASFDAVDIAAFSLLNRKFHEAIVDAAGNRALARALALNDKLPFAAAASVVWDRTSEDVRRRALMTSQIEHVLIFDALRAGQGARVEALMKEHVNVAKTSVRALAVKHAGTGEIPPAFAILDVSRSG